MSKKTIGMNKRVRVILGPRGRRILGEFLNPEAPQDRQFYKGNDAYMALWEALRIFGPHCQSSMHTEAVVEAVELAESGEDQSLRRTASVLEFALRNVLSMLVGTRVDFQAPEVLAGMAAEYRTATVTIVPDREGWWWLGEQVVRVDDQSGAMMVVMRNGRRKPVSAFVDDWCGPACMDPRVVERLRSRPTEDDSEIPF